ncbi:cyanate lyase C-terminal domain-containing protein [Trichoderma sp. SZMC 28012]
MSGRLATYDSASESRLPTYGKLLFEAKTAKALTFEQLAQITGRTEVAVAALFYGQTTATPEDVDKLSAALDIPREVLAQQLLGFPNRGQSGPMPPTEPLIYRLYEIIQNYGYSYKAVLNEKFGDGIMSGVNFTTKVEAEVDETGAKWAVITLRGKWLDFARF